VKDARFLLERSKDYEYGEPGEEEYDPWKSQPKSVMARTLRGSRIDE